MRQKDILAAVLCRNNAITTCLIKLQHPACCQLSPPSSCSVPAVLPANGLSWVDWRLMCCPQARWKPRSTDACKRSRYTMIQRRNCIKTLRQGSVGISIPAARPCAVARPRRRQRLPGSRWWPRGGRRGQSHRATGSRDTAVARQRSASRASQVRRHLRSELIADERGWCDRSYRGVVRRPAHLGDGGDQGDTTRPVSGAPGRRLSWRQQRPPVLLSSQTHDRQAAAPCKTHLRPCSGPGQSPNGCCRTSPASQLVSR
jgi:hypothetical protein